VSRALQLDRNPAGENQQADRLDVERLGKGPEHALARALPAVLELREVCHVDPDALGERGLSQPRPGAGLLQVGTERQAVHGRSQPHPERHSVDPTVNP
jgi:hypothetical protein